MNDEQYEIFKEIIRQYVASSLDYPPSPTEIDDYLCDLRIDVIKDLVAEEKVVKCRDGTYSVPEPLITGGLAGIAIDLNDDGSVADSTLERTIDHIRENRKDLLERLKDG